MLFRNLFLLKILKLPSLFRLLFGWLSQGYLKVIFQFISRLSQGCLNVIPRLSQGYLKVIPTLSQRYIKVISRLFQGYLKIISRCSALVCSPCTFGLDSMSKNLCLCQLRKHTFHPKINIESSVNMMNKPSVNINNSTCLC